MSRSLTRSYFAVPPKEYDQIYFSQLVQSFSLLLAQIQNPGDSRVTTLTITNLQSTDQGLETGALFEHDGFVKITKANTPHVGGLLATGAVGSVTVSTT
jgi:hypothetical protein